jgi:2-amino-4-hydroxy-6-hydroxymethyldihydropteridine diphosphokinase
MLALIGVGGNLGNERTIAARFLAAERALRAHLPITHSRWSRVYWSKPVGPVAMQPRFLNAVLAVELSESMAPGALLAQLLDIEAGLGRPFPRAVQQGPRTIDLDLLFVDDTTADEPGPPALRLPHPRVVERAFVLQPLADLMGRGWAMPGFAQTVDACLRVPEVYRQTLGMGLAEDALSALRAAPRKYPASPGSPADRGEHSGST